MNLKDIVLKEPDYIFGKATLMERKDFFPCGLAMCGSGFGLFVVSSYITVYVNMDIASSDNFIKFACCIIRIVNFNQIE
jgi:hypothetical protein